MGKTALARVVAQRLAGRFPGARLEINLQGAAKEGQKPLEPLEAMRLLLGPFFPGEKLPDNPQALQGLYVDTCRKRRALLLLDNAKDAAQVKPLLPPGPSAAIVTARAHIVLSAQGLRPLRLGVLPPAEARALLCEAAPRLKDEPEEALDRLAGLRDPHDPDLDVEAALMVSYRALGELQWMFRALGVFPARFEGGAAAAVWGGPAEEAGRALGELKYLSLVERDGAFSRLHDLTRAFALGRLCEQEGEARAAGERHAEFYLAVGHRANDLYQQGGAHVGEGLALFRESWPHLQAAWRRMTGEEEWPMPASGERWLSAFPGRTVYVLDLHVTAKEKIRFLEQAAKAARVLGDKGAEGRHLGTLGLAYAALGEAWQAIEHYQQALAIAKEIGDRRNEGTLLARMGEAYGKLGEKNRANALYRQALVIYRAIESPYVAWVEERLKELGEIS